MRWRRSSPQASARRTMTTSDHTPDERPPGAPLPEPEAALPGGPVGAGPLGPLPPGSAGTGFDALLPGVGFARGASGARVIVGARSRGCPGADPSGSGMSAAGAPLARIAAIVDAGGP